jgi:hypothetical protein
MIRYVYHLTWASEVGEALPPDLDHNWEPIKMAGTWAPDAPDGVWILWRGMARGVPEIPKEQQ